jgi:drug/metabolite transporter (DMT)-like permease
VTGAAAVVAPTARPVLALGLGFVVGLIWAAWVVVTARGLEQGFTPYDMTLFRFAVPAVLSLPWFFRHGVWTDWRKVVFVGACIGVPHALFVQFGIQETSTIHGAILLPGFVPICTALLAWAVLRERPTLFAAAGFALILAGVAFIALDGPDGLSSLDLVWPGDAYFIFGALLWGCFTLMLKAWTIRPMEAVALVSVVSTVVYVPIYIFFLPHALHGPSLGAFIEQGLFQGFFGILVAMALYAIVVQLAGAQRAATIAATVPILTVALTFLLIGATPTWLELAGSVAAGTGIWLVVSRGMRAPGPA